MKNKFIKMSALIIGVSLFSTGCRIKDVDSCEMVKSKIVLNLNISDELPLNDKLIDRIKDINPKYTIKNGKTNVIYANYAEANVFYTIYNEMIESELKNLNKSTNGIPRSLNNSVEISKRPCSIKKVYIDGVHTEVIDNAEFRISLQD